MTTSYEHHSVAAEPRAVSLALRMLQGAGAASLYAYRLDESIEFLAHGRGQFASDTDPDMEGGHGPHRHGGPVRPHPPCRVIRRATSPLPFW